MHPSILDAFVLIHRESLDIYNRLRSIAEDIQFVEHVHDFYPDIPFLPNLRCGAWYANPSISEPIPYFKSTDGHFNNWSFNLRRANLHLLPFIRDSGGLILVDSARAGKRMPDALSKTVPIWCSVINRAMRLRHPDDPEHNHSLGSWDTALYTPPSSVSIQEHHQIEKRLDAWARALADSSFDLPPMTKPLRPFWITPSTSTFPPFKATGNENSDNQPKFLPIICVSASRHTVEGIERRAGGYTYIQGSGDDHELWGMGLDPKKFWENKDALLASDREALADLIKKIVSAPSTPQRTLGLSSTINGSRSDATQESIPLMPIVRVNGMVSIASASATEVGQLARFLQSQRSEPSESIYVITSPTFLDSDNVRIEDTLIENLHANPDEDRELSPNLLLLTIPDGKKGQLRLLQDALPRAMSFIRIHFLDSMKRVTRDPPRICCICDSSSGMDRSVGIALAVLQIFFDDSGHLRNASDWCSTTSGAVATDADDAITTLSVACKKSIQARLEWIISSEPRANPSRTTLKRVNEFLMSPKTFRNANSMALK